MTAILGISAFFHDSAAALVIDGRIVAVAQEERFSRIKHDAGFPAGAVAWCLREAGLTPGDIDYVAFYEKPLARFDRLLETYLAYAPSGFRSLRLAIPLWIKEKLFLRSTLRRDVGAGARTPILFLDHHVSHAASAFFPSPFEDAAVLTLDGVGEWTSTACGVGHGHQVHLTRHVRFPHSLGLLYSAFTYYCGFKVNSGEYKLMGLAPYGRPIYQEVIRKCLIDVKPDGSFRLNLRYFNYCQGLTMTNKRFDRLFGGPPRRPESQLEQRHMDLAASIQAVTEDVVLRIARDLHRETQMRNLVLAGGVALNCVSNGRLLREGPFEHLWVQPAAGDAGGSLGAALFVWHQLLGKTRRVDPRDGQQGSFLGPHYSSSEIRKFLDAKGSAFECLEENELVEHISGQLAAGRIIGWFQGRMEFGPRALGARSILGDPRSLTMQSVMNLRIKFRESFRPFAPAVLADYAADWFDLPRGTASPYMMLVGQVRAVHRLPLTEEDRRVMEEDPDLCRRVNVVRSEIPAVTHVDYSARLQTVDADRNPRFHALLTAFHKRTGCPVLVNTSFNIRGEPIVCTPQEAYNCFLATDLDALVLEDCVVQKNALREVPSAANRAAYRARFERD